MTDTAVLPTPDRESLLVELVDERGRAVGECPVAEAHRAPGQLHRAFSVLLFDDEGRVLLQRRAAVKTRFPLQWANTCCGHPAPGQGLADAARARLREELGLDAELTEAGVFRYRASDATTGRVEHEWDHVFIGATTAEAMRPDPAEVAELRWLEPAEIRTLLSADPRAFTPWLAPVLEIGDAAFRADTRREP
ncbi:isopentenyl-diphosphate Delta-isomerase [Nocardia higoensis]|uniref:Isopentenyl-diphosphate Delta-isomerase n=1 Tax=Nocardia higoensis TaxID=228599 RepID=A0ABS0DM70_9NOCA|nr:isopentenyl-diphosphate Delta-isomerase [Nocardia higoensis]MBF6357808.1 isopentenyl-diphosphate Delta-isomerase [Nocardia higoensis]